MQALIPAQLWNLVEKAFSQLCAVCNDRKLIPLLEADVVGYVYHLLVHQFDEDASFIHLDTRLCDANDNDKFDIAIGEILDTKERKRLVIEKLEHSGYEQAETAKSVLARGSVLEGFRPAIKGQLILEFKFFAKGFSAAQLNRHLEMAIDDVKKLMSLKAACPEGRAVVLFDDKGYLTDLRRQKVIGTRETEDKNLRIYLFER